MELDEKRIKGRLESIRQIYYKSEGEDRKELDTEIQFLERLLRYKKD